MSWLGHHRIELAECGSTNDEAARLARAGARHGTIVIAGSQRAGRGRDGRVWASPPGLGLYLSAVVRPPLPLAHVPPMTLAIGVGLCDAVRAVGARAVLKWPNDLLVDHRKLAGVLVEAQSQGTRLEAAIVGIGVNLGGDLPDELAGSAITLAEAAGGTIGAREPERAGGMIGAREPERAGGMINRDGFIEKLLASVEHWIDRYVASGLAAVIPAWHERMATGLAVRAIIDGTPREGEVAGLDGDGALLLRDGDGQLHRVRSGEVDLARRPAAVEHGVLDLHA